jgi:hypothetical protein
VGKAMVVENWLKKKKKKSTEQYYFMRSKNTKAFHKLCNNMDGRRFLDLAKTAPITTPRNTSGSILCILKCAKAKTTELTKIEHHTGMYFVKEGRRNPRKTISSQMGAQTETTTA